MYHQPDDVITSGSSRNTMGGFKLPVKTVMLELLHTGIRHSIRKFRELRSFVLCQDSLDVPSRWWKRVV